MIILQISKFLSPQVIQYYFSIVYILNFAVVFVGSSVSKGACVPMPSSDHEEADTRMCLHIKDSLEKGARVVSVQTVDTDVIIIIAATFH